MTEAVALLALFFGLGFAVGAACRDILYSLGKTPVEPDGDEWDPRVPTRYP